MWGQSELGLRLEPLVEDCRPPLAERPNRTACIPAPHDPGTCIRKFGEFKTLKPKTLGAHGWWSVMAVAVAMSSHAFSKESSREL